MSDTSLEKTYRVLQRPPTGCGTDTATVTDYQDSCALSQAELVEQLKVAFKSYKVAANSAPAGQGISRAGTAPHAVVAALFGFDHNREFMGIAPPARAYPVLKLETTLSGTPLIRAEGLWSYSTRNTAPGVPLSAVRRLLNAFRHGRALANPRHELFGSFWGLNDRPTKSRGPSDMGIAEPILPPEGVGRYIATIGLCHDPEKAEGRCLLDKVSAPSMARQVAWEFSWGWADEQSESADANDLGQGVLTPVNSTSATHSGQPPTDHGPDSSKYRQRRVTFIGHGPLNTQFLEAVAERFELVPEVPNFQSEYIVVGREVDSFRQLLSIADARIGRVLRLHTQEMFIAYAYTSVDPATNAQVFRREIEFHPVLSALALHLGEKWPDTMVVGRAGQHDLDRGRAVGLMSALGYRVGKNHKNDRVRRMPLVKIYQADLANTKGFEHFYLRQWGPPKSADRLFRMATSIAYFARMRQRFRSHQHAVLQWEKDLEWLRKTYYAPFRSLFRWPD